MNLPKETKFLLCVDKKEKEIYILHRESPLCLIWVKQEIPMRFVLYETYEQVDAERIMLMPFVQEAKDFFKAQAEDSFNDN